MPPPPPTAQLKRFQKIPAATEHKIWDIGIFLPCGVVVGGIRSLYIRQLNSNKLF
jgi:hypothetical protein